MHLSKYIIYDYHYYYYLLIKINEDMHRRISTHILNRILFENRRFLDSRSSNLQCRCGPKDYCIVTRHNDDERDTM